jgi:hypothetical protein
MRTPGVLWGPEGTDSWRQCVAFNNTFNFVKEVPMKSVNLHALAKLVKEKKQRDTRNPNVKKPNSIEYPLPPVIRILTKDIWINVVGNYLTPRDIGRLAKVCKVFRLWFRKHPTSIIHRQYIKQRKDDVNGLCIRYNIERHDYADDSDGDSWEYDEFGCSYSYPRDPADSVDKILLPQTPEMTEYALRHGLITNWNGRYPDYFRIPENYRVYKYTNRRYWKVFRKLNRDELEHILTIVGQGSNQQWMFPND